MFPKLYPETRLKAYGVVREASLKSSTLLLEVKLAVSGALTTAVAKHASGFSLSLVSEVSSKANLKLGFELLHLHCKLKSRARHPSMFKVGGRGFVSKHLYVKLGLLKVNRGRLDGGKPGLSAYQSY